MTLGEHLTMAAYANMLYIANGYKNKRNMKVSASNTNIEIYQLSSKQWILGVHMTIAQRIISGDLTRTCIQITIKLILILLSISNWFFNSFMLMKNEKRTLFRFLIFMKMKKE